MNKIKRIILFGSVARGDADGNSDVDIFIDSDGDRKALDAERLKILDEFENSIFRKNYWDLKGINNEINVKIGNLNDWKDLKTSIESSGLVLYGQYEEMPKNARKKTYLSWENIKPESARVLFSKRLYGYSHANKKYPGLIQKYHGERIGRGIISVEFESLNTFLKLFRDMKIPVRMRKCIEIK